MEIESPAFPVLDAATDAFAPRRELLAALRDAVARYAAATGTPAWVAAIIASGYLDEHAGALRDKGATCVSIR